MLTGSRISKQIETVPTQDRPEVVIVNVSVSGSRLGGAAIAAESHSRCLAKYLPVELWRMWDSNASTQVENLTIRNFASDLPFSKLTDRLPRRAKALLFRSEILSEILKIRPAIVHLQNPGPALEFERIAQVCHRNGIKVVASTHGFYEVFNPNYGWKWYEQYGWMQWMAKPIHRSFQYLDAVLSGYPNEKQMLLDHGIPENKIHLVPNGINTYFELQPTQAEINAVIQKFGITLNHPILLFIGNHTPNKGIDTVLEVASRLRSPATVIIGGKLLSPDEPEQRRALMSSDSLAKVIFTDYLTDTEQRVLYNLSTLLLFPSLADTLPLTILEAMACGLPVVAYNTGGISYQLMNDSGIVIPQNNVSAFLDAINRLISNHPIHQQISVNARKRQQELFSWDLASQKTIRIYNSLLSKN
jgi:alpha-maltose-1-phosphate synthase